MFLAASLGQLLRGTRSTRRSPARRGARPRPLRNCCAAEKLFAASVLCRVVHTTGHITCHGTGAFVAVLSLRRQVAAAETCVRLAVFDGTCPLHGSSLYSSLVLTFSLASVDDASLRKRAKTSAHTLALGAVFRFCRSRDPALLSGAPSAAPAVRLPATFHLPLAWCRPPAPVALASA